MSLKNIVITIVEARPIQEAEWGKNEKSDSYVVVQFGKKKETTHTIKDTTNPVWNESFNFPATLGNEIVFQMYDQEFLKDDCLGGCSLPVPHVDLQVVGRFDQWLHLFDKRNYPAGELRVVIEPEYEEGVPVEHHAPLPTEQKADGQGIEITVVRAQALANKDILGKSDPYVILQLGHTKHQTTVQNGTTDPVWNQKFPFSIRHGEAIQLIVSDDDFGTDDIIGQASLDFDTLLSKLGTEFWLPVVDKSGKQTGLVLIGVSGTSAQAGGLPGFTGQVPSLSGFQGFSGIPASFQTTGAFNPSVPQFQPSGQFAASQFQTQFATNTQFPTQFTTGTTAPTSFSFQTNTTPAPTFTLAPSVTQGSTAFVPSVTNFNTNGLFSSGIISNPATISTAPTYLPQTALAASNALVPLPGVVDDPFHQTLTAAYTPSFSGYGYGGPVNYLDYSRTTLPAPPALSYSAAYTAPTTNPLLASGLSYVPPTTYSPTIAAGPIYPSVTNTSFSAPAPYVSAPVSTLPIAAPTYVAPTYTTPIAAPYSAPTYTAPYSPLVAPTYTAPYAAPYSAPLAAPYSTYAPTYSSSYLAPSLTRYSSPYLRPFDYAPRASLPLSSYRTPSPYAPNRYPRGTHSWSSPNLLRNSYAKPYGSYSGYPGYGYGSGYGGYGGYGYNRRY